MESKPSTNARVVILAQSEYFRDPRVLKESIILSENGYGVDVFCYQYVFARGLEDCYNGVGIHRILCAGVEKKTFMDVLMRFIYFFVKLGEDAIVVARILPKKGGFIHCVDIFGDRMRYCGVMCGLLASKFITNIKQQDTPVVYYEKLCLNRSEYLPSIAVSNRVLNFSRNFVNSIFSYIIYNFDMFLKSKHIKAGVYHSTDLVTLLCGFMLKKKNGGVLVYDTHELWIDSLENYGPTIRKLLGVYERFLIHRTDVVITVNDSIADELVRRYDIKRPLVVLNCPVYESPLQVKKEIDEIKILYQGVYIRDRGIEELLRSVKYFNPKCKLYLRGYDGYVPRGVEGEYMNFIRNIAIEEGIQDRVVFLDPVEMTDMVRLSDGFDIGVTPYKPTNMNQLYASPNKTFEYMMAGLAVVVSDIPEQRRFVVDNWVGVAFNPENPIEIASAINELASDPGRLRIMKENALNCAKTKYNWEIQGGKIVKMYNELCDA